MPSTAAAAKFMLQEHSRMIDVYQDLHVQKNELLKVYLAFVSVPVSIVVIFLSLYKYLETTSQLNTLLNALQNAAVYLSILLVFVGVAVLKIMLKIRGEQYLYVQTVNVARKYFMDKHDIDVAYLVLPTDKNQFTFALDELSGRTFWEAMIVSLTTSMLLAFLSWRLTVRVLEWQKCYSIALPVAIFIASAVFAISVASFRSYIRSQLEAAINARKLTDLAVEKK